MKNIIIILLLAFFPLCLTAQVAVSGVVKDSDGETLIGATVIEVGNPTNGVMTGVDGDFTITVKSNKSQVTISYIGYLSKTLAASPNMNITLESDANMLGEVEIVRMGFGTKSRISNVAAISQASGTVLRQSPSASVQGALAGRLPGLFQIQGSGQPGKDGGEMFIRGISTYEGGTSPLILIDDIESDMTTLSQLSTNEIESVSVLKDAGSTAIFGIKGANGVILVTTRRGSEGPAKVTFRADVGLQQPTYKNKFLNSYESLSLIRELLRNDGNETALDDTNLYSDDALEHFRTGDMPYRYPNVDWYDLLYKNTSLQQQYTLDVQGGTDKVSYFVSLGYLDQGGIFNDIKKTQGDFNNDYYQKRYNLRSNFDFKITKDFTLKLNANGILSEINEPHLPNPREEGTFSIFRRILGGRFTPWNYPAYNPDGSFGGRSGKSVNPLALLAQGGYSREFKNNVNGNITLEHKLDFITKGLKARGLLALTNTWGWKRNLTRSEFLDFFYDDVEEFYKPIIADQYVLAPMKIEAVNNSPFVKINTRFDLIYNRKFGLHSIGALLLGNWYSNRTGANTPDNSISYSGRLSYDYNSRYILELSGAYNGSDRFAKNNRYDFFPAASVGWNLAEEPYMKEAFGKAKINMLKLRGSYGLSGSDAISGYSYIEAYNTDMDYFFGEDPKKTVAISLKSLANQNVKWESEKKFNVGVDLKMLDSRLGITADYFYNRRSDILGKRSSMVIYAGYKKSVLPMMNIGRTENKGWDGEVSWNDKIGKDFSYFAKGTFSYAKNKIIDMDEAPSVYTLGMSTGRAIGAIFGYVADGFYNTWDEINNSPYETRGVKPGDLKYKDISGPNGVPDGVIDQYDEVEIGNSRPNFNFGFSLGFSYKNFDFSTLFQGAAGAYLSVQGMLQIGGTNGRPSPIHRGRWTQYDSQGNLVTDPVQLTEMNKNASYPILGDSNGANANQSTFWLRSADYLRWKNMELGYNLPKKWFKKIGVKSVRVYGSAQNILTISALGDYQVDPESSRTSSSYLSYSVGPMDTYPQQRIYNMGCQIVF
ncbi:MAG: TonB-dependent receptor [Prevotella sp.]|nr:TonB-dependent receptor [Prevotella sp.]